MKRNPWLGALENVSLVGLGVGSVASVLANQIFYATTPLSLLVVLNLFNRRRFEAASRQQDSSSAEMERKLSSQLELLHQQVGSLPNAEAIQVLRQGLLTKDREVARRLYAEITAIQQELNQRLNPLEQQDIAAVRQEIGQIQAKHQQTADLLAQMRSEVRQLAEAAQPQEIEAAIVELYAHFSELQTNVDGLNAQTKPNLTSLQEQISRLDRQMSKLPPPVDLSSLKQEVGELVRMISDLVPRRDFLSLVKEVRELQQQQEQLKQSVVAIESAAVRQSVSNNLLKPANSLHLQPQPPEAGNLAKLDQESDREQEFRLANLAPEPQAIQDQQTMPDQQAIQAEAALYLEHLQAQLATVQSCTETLSEQHRKLQEQINHLPQSLDVVALQNQLKELSLRIPEAENTLAGFKARIQEVIQEELRYITQELQSAAPVPTALIPDYEFVFDLNSPQPIVNTLHTHETSNRVIGSRVVLEEALESTQTRLILIMPWSNQYNLDQALMQKIEAFLDQGRQLDIGWCHLADRNDERLLKKMQRGWMSDASDQDAIQETLHHLLSLKRSYPNKFQFKVLGTSENFLVSDQAFAVLGIADALKTSTAFSELHLKLRTRDAEVIQRLIHSFDTPILASDDVVAYWNRGVTRYDLGDKTGAIADYTQVIYFDPEDAITHNYRGIAHYDTGDLTLALADLGRSIELNPHQAAAYCNRAFIQSEQGDLDSAIDSYSQAIQNRPDWGIAYFYRGLTWQKLGHHPEAISDYGEASYFVPDSAIAYYYRGLAWQKLRNYQGALADVELAARLFEARGSKTNAQKALKSLTKLQQIAFTQVEQSSAHTTQSEQTQFRQAGPVTPASVHSVQEIPAGPQNNGAPSHPSSGVSSKTDLQAQAPSIYPLTFNDLIEDETIARGVEEN